MFGAAAAALWAAGQEVWAVGSSRRLGREPGDAHGDRWAYTRRVRSGLAWAAVVIVLATGHGPEPSGDPAEEHRAAMRARRISGRSVHRRCRRGHPVSALADRRPDGDGNVLPTPWWSHAAARPWVVLNKFRCDLGIEQPSRLIEVRLPGAGAVGAVAARRLRLGPLRLGRPRPDACTSRRSSRGSWPRSGSTSLARDGGRHAARALREAQTRVLERVGHAQRGSTQLSDSLPPAVNAATVRPQRSCTTTK